MLPPPHVHDVPPPQQPTTHTQLNSVPAKTAMDSPGSDISISVGGSLVFEDSKKDQTPSSTYLAPYPSAAICHSPCLHDPTTSDDRDIKSANSPSQIVVLYPEARYFSSIYKSSSEVISITITSHSTSSEVHC